MIGRKAERILNRAVGYALDQGHEYFTLEHVLLSLLEEDLVIDTLRACQADPEKIEADLENYLSREVPKVSKIEVSENRPAHPVPTLSIQRLIQRALFHVQSAGKDEIQPADLLVALFQAKESYAVHLLNKYRVERLDVLNFISHGIRKEGPVEGSDETDPEDRGDRDDQERAATAGDESAEKSNDHPLEQYATNLNEKAKLGKIDPLIGREKEIDRMIQTLCRRRKNNPLLVGEAGVGKTALAEGLALRIVEGKTPPALQDTVIYALDLGSVIAGTKFRGDFEQRVKRVIQALEKEKQKGVQPVLFIDEIHTIVGAGAVSGGALDAANLLKPLLTRGEIRCIGSTTFAEYRSVFEKDHALARRFQKIDVVEPTQEETIQILNGLKSTLEEHHHVTYTPEAIRAAVELSVKHITDRFLPDKAIDVLDEVGARTRLKEIQPTETPSVIAAPQVEEVVALIARIPARTVSVSQKEKLQNIERDLKLTIFGQDHAIESLVTAIRLARSGLRSGDRPVGAFLFCGPTGVGKTELSKQLAHALGTPFLRYDMSEYGERHTVSRLIGAPPGYVGFEQAGLLTEAVLKNPYSVILLDEIEKAHSEIWNILLQVMDHGTLTDNSGRKADFRNAILIMTSNVGSRDMEKRPLGLTSDDQPQSRATKAVETTFSPEFRNRLDAIIYFNPLDPVTIGQVVGKQIMELESQLLGKSVEIEFSADARDWLAQKGYDKLMGARPMTRLLQEHIKKPLANEILFGKLEHGGWVSVDVKNEKLSLDIKGREKESAPSGSSTSSESAPVSLETPDEESR